MKLIKNAVFYLAMLAIVLFWVGIAIIAPVYLLYDYKKHQNLHKIGIITQAKVLDRAYRPSSHRLKSTTSQSRTLTYTYQVKNADNEFKTYTTRKEVSPYLYSKEEVDIYYCKNEVDFSDIVHNGMHYQNLGMFLFIFVIVWGFGVFLCSLNNTYKRKGFAIFF